MMPNSPKYLLDPGVLVALTHEDHPRHTAAITWFENAGKHHCGICAFTEAGFLRAATRAGDHSLEEATELLGHLPYLLGYHYWPVSCAWTTLAAPFRNRLFGHLQVTDAFLLGLAVKEKGVLVTLDPELAHLAGIEYKRHLLILK